MINKTPISPAITNKTPINSTKTTPKKLESIVLPGKLDKITEISINPHNKNTTPKSVDKSITTLSNCSKITPRRLKAMKDTPNLTPEIKKTGENTPRDKNYSIRLNKMEKKASETNIIDKSVDVFENISQNDSFENYTDCVENVNFTINKDQSVKNETLQKSQDNCEEDNSTSFKNINTEKTSEQTYIKNNKAY